MSDHLMQAFAGTADAVRKGGTPQGEHGTMAPEHPVWLSFARGMGWMMMPSAEVLAKLIPLDQTPTQKCSISRPVTGFGEWRLRNLTHARKSSR